MSKILTRPFAMRFIIFLGFVSLFADVTYEGARSITGPYLAVLGASGAAVGFIVGLGEFLGYALRFVFGYLSDKTKKYWGFTFLGYLLNLGAVPLLALAGNWKIAALLIILERFGKAVRVPSRDAMLSYATKQVGRGWGFGLHESLDQIGALTGPLIIMLVLYYKSSYQISFAYLAIPAFLSIITLIFARYLYPRPHEMEAHPASIETKGLTRKFWLYTLAVSFVACGFTDFALIAYHFEQADIVAPLWIPFLYTIAMAVDGLSALLMGKVYDVKGISFLALTTAISAFFAPLVFLGGFKMAVFGMILWGISMGSQGSIMRAVVAELVPPHKRASAYGVLYFGFGLFWFLGSSVKGLLYDQAAIYLVIFSLLFQLAAVPLFLVVRKGWANK